MPIGLEVIGTNGSTLITQDYTNMQMISKINSSSLTTSQTGSLAYRTYHWAGSVPYTDCMFAVCQTSGNTRAVRMSTLVPSGGSTSFTVGCKESDASFDVYVFRPSGSWAASSNVGFEVYRADGSLAFGSNNKPLKILSQFNWYQNTNTGFFDDGRTYGETYTGKKVACVFCNHAWALDGEGTLVTMTVPTYAAYFYHDGNGTGILGWRIQGNAGKDLPYAETAGRYMYIDVTNY